MVVGISAFTVVTAKVAEFLVRVEKTERNDANATAPLPSGTTLSPDRHDA